LRICAFMVMRGAVSKGFESQMTNQAQHVTSVMGNEQGNYRVLIYFIRRGWVRGNCVEIR